MTRTTRGGQMEMRKVNELVRDADQLASLAVGLEAARRKWPNLNSALSDLVRWIDMDLDLSDEHAVEAAEPGEIVRCSRPRECWQRGKSIIAAARSLVASMESLTPQEAAEG